MQVTDEVVEKSIRNYKLFLQLVDRFLKGSWLNYKQLLLIFPAKFFLCVSPPSFLFPLLFPLSSSPKKITSFAIFFLFVYVVTPRLLAFESARSIVTGATWFELSMAKLFSAVFVVLLQQEQCKQKKPTKQELCDELSSVF